MLRELAEYIASETPLVISVDLFAGHRPVGAIDRCVTLLERTPAVQSFAVSHIRTHFVQVLTRATSYFSGETLALSVHDEVFGKLNAGITLPAIASGSDEFLVNSCSGDRPAWLGEDEEHRHEFSANYVFRLELKP